MEQSDRYQRGRFGSGGWEEFSQKTYAYMHSHDTDNSVMKPCGGAGAG